ncbi:MAG: YraN family protein [Spirochaetales bacterium]|nr:MAG: YraN family protein [Spirochaetales bacterium]
MELSSAEKGRRGEERASGYLTQKGYRIIEKRFRSGPGEVDIIAKDGESIVFIEVKAWNAFGSEDLEHSVNLRKQRKIKQTASLFLLSHPEFNGCPVRFDLVFLSWRTGKLDHWENAF